jgi:hypothetical protein
MEGSEFVVSVSLDQRTDPLGGTVDESGNGPFKVSDHRVEQGKGGIRENVH